MITVRQLLPDDAERFKSLRLLAAETSPTAMWPTRDEELAKPIEQVRQRIEGTSTQAVFGAFDGESLIGITGVRREPLVQVGHKATIWGVFVTPAYRGQSIARALLSAASNHAAENWRVVQLMLCVNAENVAAKRLYESQGFRTFGVEPRAMRVGERFYDEEHMCKPLV